MSPCFDIKNETLKRNSKDQNSKQVKFQFEIKITKIRNQSFGQALQGIRSYQNKFK